MPSCLGIYIDKNIIKYAKVSRGKDNLNVEAFGIKIYSDLHQAIEQVISETFSFKTPISVNLSEETYNYFYMSNLLNKKDLAKAIDTEFESLCFEKQYNPNALDSRYVLVTAAEDKEKIKVIHISENKLKINKILQDFDGKKIANISPIALSIANIAPLKQKENAIIVNIEDTTTITTVLGEKVYDVQTLPVGAGQILDAISNKENSYQKAYQICKNTTIYTMEGKELQDTESTYLEDIVPTLYTIATQVRDIIGSNTLKINKVYLTGTGSVINNIDLYFEEIIGNATCEILKPFFIEDSPKINMKDYVEVNSAMALALQGLGDGVKTINFKSESFMEKLPDILTADISFGGAGSNRGKKNNINIPTVQLRKFGWGWTTSIIILAVVYCVVSVFINNQINDKENEIAETTDFINTQIAAIKSDKTKVDSKSTEYQTLTTSLQNAASEVDSKNYYKNNIPSLLTNIMFVIPTEVQLTSIENTSGKKVVINAQSKKYEQLAYFKALLKSEGVLDPTTVVSSEATKEGDMVKITIEGDMP